MDRGPHLERPVVKKLRSLCLAFPETIETNSWGHPNFRAGKKTFAAFEIINNRPSIAFRLDAADVKRVLREKNFFATPYGQQRWVSMWVDARVDWKRVSSLLERGYRTVANKRMLKALDRD